jgi:hypothetical protein
VTHQDIGYTRGKIALALSILATDEGDLRSRVPKACNELRAASYFAGFETENAIIDQTMEKVVHGDWTKVTDAEMKQLALAIFRMSERL